METFGLIPDAALPVLIKKLAETKGDRIKKFKCAMTLPTGQKVNVRWNGKEMYYRDSRGRDVPLIPPSLRSRISAEAHKEFDLMFAGIGGTSATGMMEQHVAEREANRTGNHTSRNHHVAVPTAPGESVRG